MISFMFDLFRLLCSWVLVDYVVLVCDLDVVSGWFCCVCLSCVFGIWFSLSLFWWLFNYSWV